MVIVKFETVDKEDSCDYVFVDSNNKKYHLFSDGRGPNVAGISPDFWDKFFFCERINVDYHEKEGVRLINKVISYK